MAKAIIVTAISDVKQDSNAEARNYKTLTVTMRENAQVFNPITGRNEMALGKAKSTSFNVWEKSYLNDEMEVGYDAKLNQALLGTIVTRNVQPYLIDGKEVFTYSCAVIGDTDDKEAFEISVRRAFKSAGHELLSAVTTVEVAVENEAFGG